jgi:hypothetical protein
MDMEKVKYMKTYTAFTSGSLGGRDDGYPYTKSMFFTNIRDLANDYGKRLNEVYYIVSTEPFPHDAVVDAVREEKEKMAAEEAEIQRQKDLAEYNRLKNKLKKD